MNERRLGIRVMLLTGSGDEAKIFEAIRLGRQGVVLEETAPGVTVETIGRACTPPGQEGPPYGGTVRRARRPSGHDGINS